ncbi:MAG: hypothetical protein FIA97_19685 [Methylococcaceae bacterium]|nr:hypothetical protein [Methylococcaceae bacterium]
MTTLNGKTLVLAIQAIDFKMADLEKKLDAEPPDRGADLEELLLGYSNAAEAFKRAYQEALTEVDHLPPYESLVRGSE